MIVRVEKSWGYFHTSKRTAGSYSNVPCRDQSCRSCSHSGAFARHCGHYIDMSTAATELYEKAAIAAMLCRQPAQTVNEWSLESLRLQKIHSEGTVFHGWWSGFGVLFRVAEAWRVWAAGQSERRKLGVDVKIEEVRKGRQDEGERQRARTHGREGR